MGTSTAAGVNAVSGTAMNLRLIAAIAFVVAPFGVALTKTEPAPASEAEPQG